MNGSSSNATVCQIALFAVSLSHKEAITLLLKPSHNGRQREKERDAHTQTPDSEVKTKH